MKRIRNQRGFSILEGIFGSSLFLASAMTLTLSSTSAIKSAFSNRTEVAAAGLANNLIERMRGLEPWQIAAARTGDEQGIDAGGTPGQGSFRRQWVITPDVPLRGLATIEVQVSWTEPFPQSHRVSGLLCTTRSCSAE